MTEYQQSSSHFLGISKATKATKFLYIYGITKVSKKSLPSKKLFFNKRD